MYSTYCVNAHHEITTIGVCVNGLNNKKHEYLKNRT